MLSKLFSAVSSGASIPILKYVMIAAAIIITLLITTVIIEYAIIKGYQADITKAGAALTQCEEKKAELGKTVIVKDQDLATVQGGLAECRKIIDNNMKDCSGILDAVKAGCEGLNKRYKEAWGACEAKLSNCGGGINEECSSFINRSITPFYYDSVQ